MINILSYLGMNMQSEVCLWTLLGLLRTIFDATLFKVNANLKQVWQMNMPEELSKPVQRVLRTMISGVMLVQCFTVYVYLATYIVLLYPVFLEERPTLVLPWLLLAAIRKLLCELTSLALGLGTCVLLGPARPPCIRFVIVKFISITPAFYMWMLVYSYYHTLKVAAAFKIFPATLASSDPDYGLELAVRRRRTKSLLNENQLRKKLVANLYVERNVSVDDYQRPRLEISTKMAHSTDTNNEESQPETSTQSLHVSSKLSTKFSEVGAYEDWFGSEVTIPRDTDRILEQIVLMLLRISVYIRKEGRSYDQILNSTTLLNWGGRDCTAMPADDAEPPPQVGSNMGRVRTASYLRNYPQIFMKSQGPENMQSERKVVSTKSGPEVNQNTSRNTCHRRVHQVTSHSSDRNIDRTCSIIHSNESMSSRAESSGLNKNNVLPDKEKDENNKHNKQLTSKESETDNTSLKQTIKENSFESIIERDQSKKLEVLKSEDMIYNSLNNNLKMEGRQGSAELVITAADRSQQNITSSNLEKNITSNINKNDDDNKNIANKL